MHRIIIITGTPGTGKTTLAKKLNSSLKGSQLIGANELIKQKHLYNGRDSDKALLVDVKKFQSEILKIVKSQRPKYLILEGHLMCDVKVPGAIAIVIRAHLKQLQARLAKRGYTGTKLADNLISEAVNYCGDMAAKNYAKTYEIMGTENTLLRESLSIINKKPKSKRFDLLNELTDLKNADYLKN